MGLLNPKPGEILDRLSILELKIEAAKKADRVSTHFEAEKASLNEVMRNWEAGVVEDCCGDDILFVKKQEQIAKYKNSLAVVNALLWRAEDEIRATPDEQAFKLARLCKQLTLWNDTRAKAIQILDKLYGLESEPEKLHATTVVSDIDLE